MWRALETCRDRLQLISKRQRIINLHIYGVSTALGLDHKFLSSGSLSSVTEETSLLGSYAVQAGEKLETFQRVALPSATGTSPRRLFFFYFEVVHSVKFLYQNTQFITRTKCTVLINTNIRGASPTCFPTNVPSSRRTK